mgnify:CR=1 FL=1
MDKKSKMELKSEIKNLAITKQLNILLGSGVSMPAVPLMGMVEADDDIERNNELIKIIKEVSGKLLKEDKSDHSINKTYLAYKQFLSMIIYILNLSNSRLTPKSVNLFTTNYDLFLEKAIDSLSKENRIVFNDGTNGYFKHYLDSSNYNRVVSYKGLNDNYIDEIPSINLIKPHGSINWGKDDDQILVMNEVVDNPIIVKPTGLEGQDTFLNNHFHEMLRLFQLELDKPQSVLFVIGFSFQDNHIAKMLRRALQNPEIMVFIFCYSDDEKAIIMDNLGITEEKYNLCVFTPCEFDKEILIENKNQKTGEKWYSFTIESLIKILGNTKDDCDE